MKVSEYLPRPIILVFNPSYALHEYYCIPHSPAEICLWVGRAYKREQKPILSRPRGMQGSFQKGPFGYHRALIERFSVTDKAVRMSYRIRNRGDDGMSIEPYRSHLNNMWYFHTAELAQQSANELWNRFLDYYWHGDFIGMDMARKFVQMGMVCSQYIEDLSRGETHAEAVHGETNSERKRVGLTSEAALIYKGALAEMRRHSGYMKYREKFMVEQRAWKRESEINAKKGFKRVVVPRQEDQGLETENLERETKEGIVP